jgi:antitoxin YefM
MTDDLPDIVSYSEARARLADIMDKVTDDAAPIVVTRQRRESVVIMSKREYDALQETLHLLSSPKNASRLRRAVADAGAGRMLPPPPRRARP